MKTTLIFSVRTWLFFIIFLSCFACDKENNSLLNPLSNSQSATSITDDVKEAKASYEDLILQQTKSRQSADDKKKIKTKKKAVYWDEAHMENIIGEQRLVIPFTLEEEVYFQREDGQRNPYSQSAYFTASKKNGKYEFEVILQIPDLKFSLYAKRMEDFSGTILVEDALGNFIRGYKLRDGQSYDIVIKESSPNGRVRDLTYCTTIDWYSCASATGGANWTCRPLYTETVCETTPSSGGGGATYGSIGTWTPTGSGGSSTYTVASPSNTAPINNGRMCPPTTGSFRRVGDDWFVNIDNVGLSAKHSAFEARWVTAVEPHTCFAIPAYDIPASTASVAITNAINYARERVVADLNAGLIGTNPDVMRLRLNMYIESSLQRSNPGYSYTKGTCGGASMPPPILGNYNC